MFFYVEIPGTGFQTPKVYRTVYARDLKYQSLGEYQADYITVQHNTGEWDSILLFLLFSCNRI